MNNTSSRFIPLFAAACLLISTDVFAVDSTWIGSSSGSWNDTANWSAGIPQTTSDAAILDYPVTLTVPVSIALKTLFVNAPATVNVASGATLALSNSGSQVLVANADLTIGGAGSLTFSRNGTSTLDFADIEPVSDVTITLAARITGLEGSGIELNSSGTLLLTNPDNSFTGVTRISKANGTLAFSDPGALGLTAIQFDGDLSRFVYTGTAPTTLNLPVHVNAVNATFENAGFGTLTFASDIAPATSGTKTLTFLGPTHANILSGTVSNGAGLLKIASGAGTLILNGAIIDSTVTATSGTTLAIDSNATFQNNTFNLNVGGVVMFNTSASSNFATTLSLTNNLSGVGGRFFIPDAATASTVTIPALSREVNATLNVIAPSIGTVHNKLVIQSFSAGPMPAWFTVNGLPVAYSESLGVIPQTATGATHSLTARGPSIVPNDPTGAAIIDSAGTSGGITLAADPTTLFSLTQDHADHPATVNHDGQTLAASVVAVASAGNSLTLANGTLTTPSTRTAPSAAVNLPALPTAPIAWFDLADAATVTTNAEGRISQLANKGSRGSVLDAIAPADRIGPRYVPGAVAGHGVARSDGIEPPQGLATLGNAGITGDAPRTAFIVAARSPVSQNCFYTLSLGPDYGVNKTFNIIERFEKTSFATTSNDLDNWLPSPVGHNVLTFITGQGGVPNAGEGFRNGISSGTKTFALDTDDNLIYLLHRPNTASRLSGPGEVAEALVFDYTLSESDRAAVEAYLMQKWHIVAEREETLLALRNDNPASELAVSATITEPYATKLALTKSGPGNVVLSGPLSFTGPVLLNEGTLTFNTPAAETTVLASPVSGPGAIVKNGPGALALSLPGLYTGGTLIQGGTLFPSMNGSLGSGPIAIADTGALDIANASVTADSLKQGIAAIANPITVQGAGPDGLGALRHSGVISQQDAFKSVSLSGDTAVYSATRMDVRNGVFDFGGHTLTVNGGGEFAIVNSEISNVTSATAVHVAEGMMQFEQSDFGGSAANFADAVSGSGISLYQMIVPMQWSLLLANNAYLRVKDGGMNTSLNQWAGPVTLDSGTACFNALAGGTAAITGVIGGDGGLLKDGSGWFWLLNSANTYAGTTVVTQGNLYAVSPGSIGTQGSAGLTVSDTGSFIARAASATSTDGWTASEIGAIAGTSLFATPDTSFLGIDTFYEDFDYTDDFPYLGLKKLGPYTLRLTGAAPDLGSLMVYDGELDLTDSGDHNLHTHSMFIGASPDTVSLATLRLANAALSVDDPGYNRQAPSLTVGSAANARGIVYVGENAVVSARLMIGDAVWSAGAVYQSSGIVTNISGGANDGALGSYGYGYYRLDDGELSTKGYTQLGRHSGSVGILEQRGGSFVLNPGIAPAVGVVGDYYNGSLGTRRGVGVYLLSGGTFNLNARSLQLGEWSSTGDYLDGNATLTLENDAQADIDFVMLANRNGNPEAYVNLNGGTLITRYFQKGGANAAGNTGKAVISFNGGTLRAPSAGALVRTGANNTPALLCVNAGGAIIDTPDSANMTLDQPLQAPANFGVTDIAVISAGAGYIAPPAVLIGGGNGIGATAVAEIDHNSGTLTRIRVTSPGGGYTTPPTVNLRGGGAIEVASLKATLGVSASGGLVKLGTGTLELTAVNTYTGPTVVSNGVLRLSGGSETLSAATPLTVAGGLLDLGGATHTNLSRVTLQSGHLVNGTLSAPSVIKSGPGTATFATKVAAPAPAALREVFIHSLEPIIWYDPSDTTAGNVVIDTSSRVSHLRNKGTLGSSYDAIPYSGTGPLLLSGAASPSPLSAGVLQIDNNTASMTTAANVPITGAAPRTLVALLARTPAVRINVGIGTGLEGESFEIGNDPAKTYITGLGGGRDSEFIQNIPAPDQLTFIAAVNGYGGNLTYGVQLWRSTGEELETLTATWPTGMNTGTAPFSIGRRGGATGYRGKIGDILLFDRILSESEIAELKDVLTAKYLAAPSGEESTTVPPITVAEGTLRLAPCAESIAALAPIAWYDPSDAASVTLDGSGRITGIRSKGSRSDMDAVTGIGLGSATLLAPQLVTGALSYAGSGLPMINIDGVNRGLASHGNTEIVGTASRTTVGVFARDNSSTGPITSFGNGADAQLWEFGDRHNGNVVGCFGTGNDMFVLPLNPAQQAHVFIANNIALDVNEFWRTGLAPNYTSHTIPEALDTVNSRFFIGQRPNTPGRTEFRGQIGELLLFDRLLTPIERFDLEDYLVTKWMKDSSADDLYSDVVFDVASGATLDLGGARDNITVTGSGTLANGTLGAGFVISPAGDSAIGELDLTNITFAAGAEYRLTTSGNTSDRLLVDGDLSALTIVPATDAEITGRTYIIATGATTGKPALSGFPDKYKIVRKGADLLLTSTGGTLIIIR